MAFATSASTQQSDFDNTTMHTQNASSVLPSAFPKTEDSGDDTILLISNDTILPLSLSDEESRRDRIRMFGISALFCLDVLLNLVTLWRIQRKAIPTKSRLLYYTASTLLVTYVLSQGRFSLLSIASKLRL